MNRIREARKAKGISMRELGRRIGVSEGAISHYELGHRQPNYETLLKIGEELNVSVAYLLGEANVNETNAKLSVLNLTEARAELMDAAMNMTDEEIRTILNIIKAIKGK